MNDEAIAASILAQLGRGPEAAGRVTDFVVRELGVAADAVRRVAGELTRQSRLRVQAQASATGATNEVWALPAQQVRAADEQAVEAAIVGAIDRISRESGLARPIVAQVVARIATRLIARGA